MTVSPEERILQLETENEILRRALLKNSNVRSEWGLPPKWFKLGRRR